MPPMAMVATTSLLTRVPKPEPRGPPQPASKRRRMRLSRPVAGSPTRVPRCPLLLAVADATLTATGKEYRLKEALQALKGKYDYCIVDTPPALGILTVNALTAATGAIIPAQADIFSLQGIGQLGGTLDAVKKYCNPDLSVMGILLTRYNDRAVIGREAAEMTERTAGQLGTELFTARIRECTAIKEAQARRQSIYSYAPKSNAAADYAALVAEIMTQEEE